MRKQKDQPIPRLKISEADVQQAVVLMLELDGWRSLRTDPVSNRARATGFGEVGMPDYLFIRYLPPENPRPGAPAVLVSRPALAEVLWIEFKAPSKIPKPHQLAWHDLERKRGASTLFIDGADTFRAWYKTSGLMRHQILS